MKRNGNKNTWAKVTSKSAIIRGNNAPNAKHINCFEPLKLEHSSDGIDIEKEQEAITSTRIQTNNIQQSNRPNFMVNRHHKNNRINYRPKHYQEIVATMM